MLESVKTKLWDMLKEKKISMALIYHRDGEILWHKGRRIRGRSVRDGEEFCKSLILQSIENRQSIERDNVFISLSGDGISESAERLRIRSVHIQPIEENFFLYVDSGTQVRFDDGERELLRTLGGLFAEALHKIRENEESVGGLPGNSPAIVRTRNLALKFAVEEDCVLILGETGAGKSHLANLLHVYSGRKGKFVVADTTTINENLFESVIFGHKKGSFTGAVDDRKGLIQEADGGTLFLDEIAEVPNTFQAKLLRFIETKKYRVLGDPAEKTADVRILAATNRDLKQQIKQKLFREDLFYRLNILTINLPPLRERKEDLRQIVEDNISFLKGKKPGPGFWDTILNYEWPGNFRELFAVLKRAGILCDSPVSGKDIESMLDKDDSEPDDTSQENSGRVDQTWKDMQAGKNFWDAVKEPFMDRILNRDEVKTLINRGLEKADGRFVDALQYFNLDRSEYKKFMKFIHNNKIKL